MSRFSERLKDIVEEAGITQYMLARNADVDRPTLCRILSGSRPPSDENRVKLYEALNLPRAVTDELEELAEIDRDGESLVRQRRALVELIEKISEHEHHSQALFINKTVEYPQYLENRTAFTCSDSLSANNLVKSIIEAEYYGNEHTDILLFCPFGYEMLYSLICELGYTQPGRLSVRHLVGLESMSSTSGVRNVEIMQRLLPFSLNCSSGYSVANFHELRKDIGRFHTPFPYFVVVNDTLLMLESNFGGAVMIKEPEVVALYKDRFDRIYEQSTPFTINYSTPIESLLHQDAVEDEFNMETYQLMVSAPATCLAISAEQIVDHRRREIPGIEELAQVCLVRYRKVHENTQRVKRQFFSLEGLDNFLTSGYSREFPREFIEPFTDEELLSFVETYKEVCAAGEKVFILNPKRLNVPTVCNIKAAKKAIDFSMYTSEYMCTVLVTDESVCSALQDFLEYLPGSRYVYSPQQAEALLEERALMLRRRIAEGK